MKPRASAPLEDNGRAASALPPTEGNRAARIAQALEDTVSRRLAGDGVSDAKVLARYPDLQPDLAEKLADLHRVEQVLGSSAVSTPQPTESVPAANDAARPAVSAVAIPGYELIREIHRGGQGVIYEAYQKSTKQHVAVKFVYAGPVGGVHARERFVREVEILGSLKHPNIVAIHDSGTVAGLLYFVMDYIPGQALDAHVAERWGMPAAPSSREPAPGSGPCMGKWFGTGAARVRAILELFAKVCDAVNAAHLRGVIHRDLKPSNIRVDAAGEPQVVDFGLAKLTSTPPDGGPAPERTATGQFVGSLPWASPEQASGSPDQIDTRTDVYSLGVVLYQLLTGRFPYEVDGPVRDVLDRIVHTAPLRPSALARDIDNEVETIVLKCLAKDRERRYQTAGELGGDVRDYLAGRPIAAKRDSTFYLVRKSLGRHRVAVAFAGLFVLLLAGSTVLAWSLYVQADHARVDTAKERDRAVAAERDAADMNGFFTDMLAGLERPGDRGDDRSVTPVSDFTVREMLDRAAAQVATRFNGRPELAADIRARLAQAFAGLGCYPEAEQQARLVVQRRSEVLGPEHLTTLREMKALEVALFSQGKLGESLSVARQIYEGFRHTLGPDDCETLHAVKNLAIELRETGKLAEAEALLRQLLATQQRVDCSPPTDLYWFTTLSLGLTLVVEGRLAEAESFVREAVQLDRDAPTSGEARDRAAYAKSWLGVILAEQGRYAEAEPLLNESVQVRRALWGEHSPHFRHVAVFLMAVRAELGQLDEAKTTLRAIREGTRRSPGSEFFYTTHGVPSLLARVLAMRGEFAEAEQMLLESIPLARRTLGDEAPLTLDQLDQLGVALRGLGRLDEAEQTAAEVVQTAERVFPDGRYYHLPEFHDHWGRCLMDLGHFDEAEPQLRAAYQGEMAMRGPDHKNTREDIVNLVHLYEAWGQPDEAAQWRSQLPTTQPASGPAAPP